MYLRIRPPVRIEETPGALAWKHRDRSTPNADDQNNRPGDMVTLYRPDAPVPQSDFVYDCVFGPSAPQQDVYTAAVKDVVSSILAGWEGEPRSC